MSMDPMHHRAQNRHRRHHGQSFAGEVAHRVKHKVAVKIAMALLKLAVVAFFCLLAGFALVIFYLVAVL